MNKVLSVIAVLILLFSCNKKESKTEITEKPTAPIIDNSTAKADFLTFATEIAQNSQQALGGQLKAKLMEGGAIHALDFCSVEAIPITDSLSKIHNATIRRVSDKNRNPDNKANESELNYINFVKEQIAAGKKPEPSAEIFPDRNVAYLPIITNAMCVQCHGEPENTLANETLQKIQSLYPEDKAIGYGADQLRGIWVIEVMQP